MKALLLYSNREWVYTGSYYDTSSVIGDLGLDTLFHAAAKDVVYDHGKVKYIQREDPFLVNTMKKVMMVPLHNTEEILYRQAILQDCIIREGFVCELYDMVVNMLEKWDQMGRKSSDKTGNRSPVANLIDDLRVMKLFTDSLSQIKLFLGENIDRLSSKGFQSLYERLCQEFSNELEQSLYQILNDVSFFTDVSNLEAQRNRPTVNHPQITFECGIGDGLKFGDFKLEGVATRVKKYRNPNNALVKLQGYVGNLTPDSFSAQKSTDVRDQATDLEFQIVSYVYASCTPFINSFYHFFDQLRVQLAFYRGAINIKHHIQRFRLGWCMPVVGSRDTMCFQELKEVVMAMEQRIDTIGNSCDMNGKMLMIVTGANQGGKSTFLRSIGIAQVMMQCGLMVAAESYQSGLFPEFFTHFTRREDSAMNSGRLDEELKRMSQIVDHLGNSSMVLLNESFASTTEKEGSVIAYDIIKALLEHNVKILTVTHLLSFAQRVFDESEKDEDSEVVFLSAERLENGKRTYKMIAHEPELTSFGLDLYREIVGKEGNQ